MVKLWSGGSHFLGQSGFQLGLKIRLKFVETLLFYAPFQMLLNSLLLINRFVLAG